MSQRTSETNKLNLRRLIWEARDGHTHARRADQASDEDEQVRAVAAWHALPDLLRDRHQEHARDGMTDEGRYNLRNNVNNRYRSEHV